MNSYRSLVCYYNPQDESDKCECGEECYAVINDNIYCEKCLEVYMEENENQEND